MGFRFRKSFKVAPGVRMNVSKRGVDTTIGGKGLRVNTSFRGVSIGSSIRTNYERIHQQQAIQKVKHEKIEQATLEVEWLSPERDLFNNRRGMYDNL